MGSIQFMRFWKKCSFEKRAVRLMGSIRFMRFWKKCFLVLWGPYSLCGFEKSAVLKKCGLKKSAVQFYGVHTVYAVLQKVRCSFRYTVHAVRAVHAVYFYAVQFWTFCVFCSLCGLGFWNVATSKHNKTKLQFLRFDFWNLCSLSRLVWFGLFGFMRFHQFYSQNRTCSRSKLLNPS